MLKLQRFRKFLTIVYESMIHLFLVVFFLKRIMMKISRVNLAKTSAWKKNRHAEK